MKVYPAKVFKSGNSVALRLPKALGLTEGMELQLVQDDQGRLLLRSVDRAHAGLTELFGSFSSDFMANGRIEATSPTRDWDDVAHRAHVA